MSLVIYLAVLPAELDLSVYSLWASPIRKLLQEAKSIFLSIGRQEKVAVYSLGQESTVGSDKCLVYGILTLYDRLLTLPTALQAGPKGSTSPSTLWIQLLSPSMP